MHVGKGVLPRHQRLEKARTRVAFDQVRVLPLAGCAVEIGPSFEHPTCFDIEDVVHLLTGKLLGPAMKPVGELVRDRQGLRVAGEVVHVVETHEGLVNNVLRRPGMVALGGPGQVFLGYRGDPPATVLLLAPTELRNDEISLQLQLFVACRGLDPGGSGEPVAKEVSADFARRGLPAPMKFVTGTRVTLLRVS